MKLRTSLLIAVALCPAASFAVSNMPAPVPAADLSFPILTPRAPSKPRVNGPTLFGVRPGSAFLYTIPATGERPMQFSVEGLPAELTLDPVTGRITGVLKERGEHRVVLRARNAKGASEKKFKLVVGDRIALTPPLGWNSWNCWAEAVSQEKVIESAKAMVSSGLINHGWTYINIDDTWQGKRGGPFNALQGNQKFPDIKGLSDEVHRMGLKLGIYSTPWITSYAKFAGGSSDNEKGDWTQKDAPDGWRMGKHSFAEADTKQWAAWEIDYLKYDWAPIDVPHVEEMSNALHRTGRDIVFSLSNSAPFEHAADWARLAECWRTTGDITDCWEVAHSPYWQYAVSEIGFAQDRWSPFAGAGHWNDPDMLVVGKVGWGKPHESGLTANEQYTHISLWCLLSAPLLIGCDMEHLTPFTVALLSNDEVLALDQDALGKQAVRVATVGPIDIFSKELEDGSRALGFFNRGSETHTCTFDKLERIDLKSRYQVRDLWRQTDLQTIEKKMTVTVPAHGVQLYKLTPVK